MLKKISKILIIISLGAIIVSSQNNNQEPTNYEKAKIIIKQSQLAIYQKVKREDIKSIMLKSVEDLATDSVSKIEGVAEPRESNLRQTTQEDILFELTNKLNQTILSYDADKNSVENFTKIHTILNGDKFLSNSETIRDGKRVDFDGIFNSPFLSESMKKQMKELREKSKPTKDSIQKGIYERFFPILLDMNWASDKTFIYIGKAEAGETKADILEVESITGRQTRYFFDEKTHILVMVTDEFSKDGNSSKTTTYFSEYQTIDGLFVAKKLNVVIEGSVANIEMEMFGKKIKVSSKSKTTSETIIKEFKINPKFKPETFVVNEVK